MRKALLLLSVMLSANCAFAAQQTNSVPQKFEAEFVGMMASYSVRLQGGSLRCRKSSLGKETTVQISPSKQDWAEFWQALDKAGAWSWRTNYQNNAVMDGMVWSLRIDYADRSMRARGRNRYPEEKGQPGPDPNYTKAFELYTQALDKLTGSKFMKE